MIGKDYLVINAGSSSLKYKVYEEDFVKASGACERIGAGGCLTLKKADKTKTELELELPTHEVALHAVLEELIKEGIIRNIEDIRGIGHRITHGGTRYKESVIVTAEVLEDIEKLEDLSPLHNVAQANTIRACMKYFPSVPMVAVFDTAFHSTMPAKAYTYPIPKPLAMEYGIRRYGFHGTSHRYITGRVAELGDKMPGRLIVCHLGNGSSITAVQDGHSIDTTMGLTPLEGLIMGTRCGSIDPAVVSILAEKLGKTAKEIEQLLNKKSGLLGVSGFSSDYRDVKIAEGEGNPDAKLALDILYYQVIKYIGGYTAAMNGLDALAFTGGIGENSSELREMVCRNLQYLGVEIDDALNRDRSKPERRLSTDRSKVQVWVIPTDEEGLILSDTKRLVK